MGTKCTNGVISLYSDDQGVLVKKVHLKRLPAILTTRNKHNFVFCIPLLILCRIHVCGCGCGCGDVCGDVCVCVCGIIQTVYSQVHIIIYILYIYIYIYIYSHVTQRFFRKKSSHVSHVMLVYFRFQNRRRV